MTFNVWLWRRVVGRGGCTFKSVRLLWGDLAMKKCGWDWISYSIDDNLLHSEIKLDTHCKYKFERIIHQSWGAVIKCVKCTFFPPS